MKAHWFPVLLFLLIAVVVASESISGYRKRKEEDKAFAAFIAAEPVDTVWRG